MLKTLLRYFSPIALIIVCSVSAVLLYPVFGKWVYIPVVVLYWGISFLIAFKFAGVSGIKRWLQKPSGKIHLLVLSVIVGFIPLQIFLTNLHIITLPLAFLSIPFVLLNPFFEELYWIGFVLDFTFSSKKISSLYSSILFILSHLFIWGVFSYGNRNYFLIGSLAIMSTVWCIVRVKAKSLWWCIISHFFVDVFNLMIFVMFNLVIPEKGYISVLELLFGKI
jgi:membrane protease YdiL (CAAX protease family)